MSVQRYMDKLMDKLAGRVHLGMKTLSLQRNLDPGFLTSPVNVDKA